ncbi:MAG: glucose-1-phosphate adenylyltransferase [Planctomycetota bacterium]|nr:MAG: glucose-1-phosphate adenylyltransferase [Planctomycetota bacterium]
MKDILAVVLGGGAGSRLYPLTKSRSKPAVPLAGKYRLIDIPLSNCINSGIERIFVLTQFNSASLNSHIAKTYRFDRFSKGFVSILAAEQTPESKEWFQGTADAVRQSLYHLDAHPHSHVLILSGDQLYKMDYRSLFEFHKKKEAEITIATIPVTADEACGFGIMKTDDEGQILEFWEKPSKENLAGLESKVSEEEKARGKVYLASMGIYIFNRSVLREELENDSSITDFGKEVIPKALKNRKVFSYPFSGYWSDIGTIRSFYEANLELAKRKPAFDLYSPSMPIYTDIRDLPPVKIESSFIQDSIIAEGSLVVNGQIISSVLGVRSIVGKDTTIKNSILMGCDYYPWHYKPVREEQHGPDKPGVGEGSYLDRVIVDKNVSIGMKCVITNRRGVKEEDGANYFIRDYIVILPKNAVIPDGTII